MGSPLEKGSQKYKLTVFPPLNNSPLGIDIDPSLTSPKSSLRTLQVSFFTKINRGCAHYVMVSKIQWKPFRLATQLYPQNDWTGTMTYSHPILQRLKFRFVRSEKMTLKY